MDRQERILLKELKFRDSLREFLKNDVALIYDWRNYLKYIKVLLVNFGNVKNTDFLTYHA